MPDCLFCAIVRKEIKAKVIHEDDKTLAFHDINPQAPVHVLIVPKKHIGGVGTMETEDAPLLGTLILKAKELAQENRWTSYRLVLNHGVEAGQSVFHVHLHLLSGRRMKWPPG